jgi:hypothetical protein
MLTNQPTNVLVKVRKLLRRHHDTNAFMPDRFHRGDAVKRRNIAASCAKIPLSFINDQDRFRR